MTTSRLVALVVCASAASAAASASAAAAAASPAPRPPVNVTFTVHTEQTAQVILGLGFEIQSDSIGSGNHGLPDSNSSVPWDLVPSERDRFYSEMLTGFRYCRLALGLYFRGLTPDNKSIIERWPGQAAVLAEMATKSGLEGFAVEYWSPAPGWKSTGSYIDGTLVGYDEATLADFAAHTVGDVEYLTSNGLNVVLWGLQNEPPVGPSGCIYSCCGYSSSQYYLAFNATARAMKAAFPKTLIHATSWSGPLYSKELAQDPAARALVDLWTVHCVGCNSDVQIADAASYLNASQGTPIINNEFEYLDDYTNPERTVNTAQSIMNWLTFLSSPSWYWLHALKPLVNAEASGYGLGYWQPLVNGTGKVLEPGYWDYNPDNSNALLGFTKYMPWDSVRVNVTEENGVNPDVRVLAYTFDPAKARFRGDGGAPRAPPPSSSSYDVLEDETAVRSAATDLAVVLTNRWNLTDVVVTVVLDGAAVPAGTVFEGHLYSGNATDVSLGTVTAQQNSTSGAVYFTTTVLPLSIHFWVQQG